MELFKNKVGRPSKEIIRKRRIFTVGIIALIVAVVGGTCFLAYNALSGGIESGEKNAAAVSITFGSLSPSSPTQNTTRVNFSHTIKNATGKYMRWFLYTGDANGKNFTRTNYGSCQKVPRNPYNESDYVTNSGKQKISKRLTVAVYSDSKCTDSILTQSKVVYFGGSSGGSTPSTPKVTGKLTLTYPSVTSYKYYKVPYTVAHTGNGTLYVKIKHLTNGQWTNPISNDCLAIGKGKKVDLTLSVNKNSTNRQANVRLYNDKGCTNQIDNKNTNKYTYNKKGQEIPDGTSPVKTVTGYCWYTDANNRQVSIEGKKIISGKTITCTNSNYAGTITWKFPDGTSKKTTPSQKTVTYKVNKIGTLKITGTGTGVTPNPETKNINFTGVEYNYPKISKACVKNGYVYISATDDYGIKKIGYIVKTAKTNASDCKVLKTTTPVSNLKSISLMKVANKPSQGSKFAACVWDSSNNLSTKDVAKSC